MRSTTTWTSDIGNLDVQLSGVGNLSFELFFIFYSGVDERECAFFVHSFKARLQQDLDTLMVVL